MYGIFLAFRWLAARPIGIITMVGIWLSVMATIVTLSVMSGFLRDHERAARGTTSDVVIAPQPRRGADGAIVPAADFASVKGALKDVAGIAGMSPRLLRGALWKLDRVEASVVLTDKRYIKDNFVRLFGIDPNQDGGAADFKKHLDLPSDARSPYPYFSDEVDDKSRPFWIDRKHVPARYRNQPLPIVLMGLNIFERFDVRKGERLTLMTIPESADPKEMKPLSQDFIVGGAVRTGNAEFDGSAVYLELGKARDFTRSSTDATEVCVTVLDGADPKAVAAAIRRALSEHKIRADVADWREKGKRLLDAVSNERALIGVLLFFFIAVACFNVLSTLTILVTDKTRDIGVLGALGAKSRGIQAIFLGNGLLMALIAGALGVRYGVKLTQSLNPVNDWFASHLGVSLFPRNVFAFDDIPYEIVPSFVLWTLLATLALSLLSAWIPARRAASFDPVEALRYE